jgi:hypothetical protein
LADVTYLEAEGDNGERQIGFHVPAGVRIHGYATRRSQKKSFRLYFRQEYGLSRLDYPLLPAGDTPHNTTFKRLVIRNGGQDSHRLDWTLLRPSLMYQLVEQTGGYTARCQPVLLFLNGELYGIYQIHNRIDDWFYADEYGIEVIDEQETAARWEELLRFFETHDLTHPENYAFVESQIDIANWIDYYILQIYAANTDWIYTNTRYFRPRTQGGRWHWVFWDVDWSFGLVAKSDQNFNMMNWFLTTKRTGFQRNALPFFKLLENPDFRTAFLSRTADLLNSVLAPEHIVAKFDDLASELRPDIDYEVGRWSSRSNWETNVARMRTFILQRPDALRQHLVDHFGLDGTARLEFNSPAAEGGSVAVNGMMVPESWQGVYFMGTTVDIVAVPERGFCFSGWLPAELPQTAELTVTVDGPEIFIPLFDRHCSQELQPGDVVITHIEVDDDGETAEGDWFELMVTRSGGVDLRGWRITDNDTKTATNEGALIFSGHKALANVPQNTTILVVATETPSNDREFQHDDLTSEDRKMVLYAGNGRLDARTDPWFNLAHGDNLALLAPGTSSAPDDDQGIAFATIGRPQLPTVTAASFGVSADGITTGIPEIDHW